MAERAAIPPQPKPPAMQFYVRDWLASTVGMPLDAKGLHIDLLCIAWDNGALPDDAKWRQRVAGVSAPKSAALWAILRNRWKKTRHGWINPRQERQRRALAAYRAHAEHAASMRWASVEHQSGINRASVEHGSGMPRAHAQRMPNRSISISSSSSSADQDLDQDQPAAPRPARFRTYAAIATQVLRAATTDDLTELAEQFKSACAKQGLPYAADITRKALAAASVARTRRRA